ncbi:hypothetical protein R5W23_006423 [Gemmata sp. JC673]|uniref:Type II toxin-antitoxin system RelE/ParE family toxin n=1 Tax=Gemmata algarum TaxID=2975278 RepID=A0ABU5EVM5_9BACT|nr:hypothetical protein [Gemmata algarum]MDY3559205.1 hypothetical protein [Gemmata algarum]
MNYTVRWLPLAEARLRWLWTRAFLKESIAELADIINRLLRDRPFDLGESRERADIRLWFHRPLCVAFFIDDGAKVVYVAAVKWVGN